MLSAIVSDLRKLSSAELLFFLLLYCLLGAFTLQELGVVGEAAALWTATPVVLSSTEPPEQSCRKALLSICQTRPSFSFLSIPLSLNLYSGGLFDAPAKVLFKLTQSWRAVQLLNLFWGLCIILLTTTVALKHFNKRAAVFTLALLSCDTTFILYKKWLYGIEVGLQLGLLLSLWGALELRENKKGHWKLMAGVSIALYAKWSAFLAVAPLLLLLKRKHVLLFFPALIWPLISALAHFDVYPPVRSHDGWVFQWNRVLSSLNNNSALARESWGNLPLFLMQPTEFFHHAYGADRGIFLWPFKLVGWLVFLRSMLKNRHEQHLASFFFVLLFQLLLLAYVAKDMHHLAMLTPCLLLLTGLGLSFVQRGELALLLFIVPSSVELFYADKVLKTIQIPTFTATAQKKLVRELSQANVRDLVTMDYEVYGVLEALTPDIVVTHSWAAISHEKQLALPRIVSHSVDKNLIVLEASQPMIYNLRPTQAKLKVHADNLGLLIEETSAWPGSKLYTVTKK